MENVFKNGNLVKYLLFISMLLTSSYIAAEDYYTSELVNQSKHAGSNGFKLVRTKLWPNTSCVVDSGKEILYPGETGILKIKKTPECKESGVGYSIYKLEDTNNEHLFGYVSHRLGDGKFSVQVSRFCEGKQCVFWDLNPEQNRGNK